MGTPKISNVTLENLLVHLMTKLDTVNSPFYDNQCKKSMREEMRTLEFWRAIIAECLATFFYVFLVCSVYISWTGSLIAHQPHWTIMALTNGLAMATLSQCFGHISGANVNPAVTCSLLVTRRITPLRAVLYIIAQCGGSIAGAALLYGVSVPGHQGALGISIAHEKLGSWQIFGVEFVLTFLVVFTIFATLDSNRKSLGSDSLSIGIAYLVCSLSGVPASGASMNPARTLGPAFVMNRWKHHWVYWMAPITGGMLAALIYHFIFDTRKLTRKARLVHAANTNAVSTAGKKDYNRSEYDTEYDGKTGSSKSSSGITGLITNSASSYSNSGSSSNSSGIGLGIRTNQCIVGLQGAINSYDNYNRSSLTSNANTNAIVTGRTISPDSGQFHHTMTLPSNNYHQAPNGGGGGGGGGGVGVGSYAGIYNRTTHTLKSVPKLESYLQSVGSHLTSNGQTKF